MSTRTGYMTLPKPVYANTLWAEYVTASYPSTETQGDNEPAKRYLRATPSIYWAMLYNRAFEIIDSHDHRDSTNTNDQGSYYGKPISNTMGWKKFSSNLDMKQGFFAYAAAQSIDYSYGLMLNYGSSGIPFGAGSGSTSTSGTAYSPGGGFNFNAAVNISEMQYRAIYFGHPGYDDSLHENLPLGKYDIPEHLRDPARYKGSLFARTSYAHGLQSGSTKLYGSENYNFHPSIPLLWTTGDNREPVIELINNTPPGAIPGAYQYAGLPNSTEDTIGYNLPNTLQPFIGVEDKGVNGYLYGYATTSNPWNLYPYYRNGRGWQASWHSGTNIAATFILWDVPEAKDCCTIYSTKDVVNPDTEQNNRGIGNDAWTYFSYYPDDGSYTPRPHWSFGATYRYGYMTWFSDMSGFASTYNQTVEVQPSTSYSTAVTHIRWHGNTASPKHWASDGSGTDILKLENNKASFLLVKATDVLWFAYFKQ